MLPAVVPAGPARPSWVLGVSWRSWQAVTSMRRPGREGFVNNCEGSSRFRPELHTPVTLLRHPQVDGPKSPLYLDFSARQHLGSDGMRTKHEEAGRKCGVRGVSLTSPRTASQFLHSFHTRPSRARSQPARAVTETASSLI